MPDAVTLECDPPLAIRVALVLFGTLPRAMFEQTFAGRIFEDTRGVVIKFTEPLECVAMARWMSEPFSTENKRESRASIRGVRVSALAAELLKDATEPTRSAFRWMLHQLDIDPSAIGDDAFAAARRGELTTGNDQPHLALALDGEDFRLFGKSRVQIGRGSQPRYENDVVIRDGNISRKHCAFVFAKGRWYFKDLGSAGGCDWKGMRVDNFRVATGDVFELAGYELQVVAAL